MMRFNEDVFQGKANGTCAFRWCSNQWNPERISKLDKLTGVWVQKDGSLTREDDWEETRLMVLVVVVSGNNDISFGI
jgi:hypothetical protein